MNDTNIAGILLLALLAILVSIVVWGCTGHDASGVKAEFELRAGREVNSARLFDLSKETEANTNQRIDAGRDATITTINRGSRGVTYSLLALLGGVLFKDQIMKVVMALTHRCVVEPIKTIIKPTKREPPRRRATDAKG